VKKYRVFKLVPTVGLLLVLGVVSLGASYVVGRVGADPSGPVWSTVGHFDWTLAVDTGIAVGTLALAGFTGALAWVTSRDVSATRESVDLTREDMRMRSQPRVLVADVVTDDVVETGSGWFTLTMEVSLRNVGLGAAFRVEFVPQFTLSGDAVGYDRELYVIPAIPPGGVQLLEISCNSQGRDVLVKVTKDPNLVRLEGTYLDSSLDAGKAEKILDVRDAVIAL
jgi:hypothetical protein